MTCWSFKSISLSVIPSPWRNPPLLFGKQIAARVEPRPPFFGGSGSTPTGFVRFFHAFCPITHLSDPIAARSIRHCAAESETVFMATGEANSIAVPPTKVKLHAGSG